MCSVTEPALAASLNGLPDEEVAFVCDEMADLVWAVHRRRNVEHLATAADTSVEAEQYPYQISTDIREHLILLGPVQGVRNSIWLRRGRILDQDVQSGRRPCC
jgi:hypothetical protein